MKKGLRRWARCIVQALGVNRSPDEEGITTDRTRLLTRQMGVNRSPDEEGITTLRPPRPARQQRA